MHKATDQAERLWHELHRGVRGYFRKRVTDDALADDLLQQTFVAVVKGLPGVRDSERLTGWVYRIARNVLTDHLRSGLRVPPGQAGAVDVDQIAGEPHASETIATDTGRWLIGMIDALPAAYREAVRLIEIDGLTQREAAERLGLSVSGAKSRVQRGRAMLKQMLQDCCELAFDRRGNLLTCDTKARGDSTCGCAEGGTDN